METRLSWFHDVQIYYQMNIAALPVLLQLHDIAVKFAYA